MNPIFSTAERLGTHGGHFALTSRTLLYNAMPQPVLQSASPPPSPQLPPMLTTLMAMSPMSTTVAPTPQPHPQSPNPPPTRDIRL
mmetsp:Transcript_14737/g.23307  ORF Transcript_14737/g.23307 Transcript_14737/m.23307 type:complete len:85 (+) Transcript_14737:804-1058(+)